MEWAIRQNYPAYPQRTQMRIPMDPAASLLQITDEIAAAAALVAEADAYE